jgi:two-component system response regulator
MNFEAGVPDEFRTLVAVPMLLLSEGAIREEIDALEVRYLANPDPNLRFALLSDFADAPERTAPDDEALLKVARYGIEALDFLFARGAHADRASAPLPTIVILDLKLPKLDGLGVLKAIRADPRTQYLPVVILTSSKEEQDLISGYALGANSYVRKPVDFAEFLEAVKVLGIYWLMMNEIPPQSLPQ